MSAILLTAERQILGFQSRFNLNPSRPRQEGALPIEETEIGYQAAFIRQWHSAITKVIHKPSIFSENILANEFSHGDMILKSQFNEALVTLRKDSVKRDPQHLMDSLAQRYGNGHDFKSVYQAAAQNPVIALQVLMVNPGFAQAIYNRQQNLLNDEAKPTKVNSQVGRRGALNNVAQVLSVIKARWNNLSGGLREVQMELHKKQPKAQATARRAA